MSSSADLFVSYASPYRRWVDVLAENLRGCDHEVFVDHEGITPGRSWWASLQAGLERAPRLLLVITPEAMASPWVQQEVAAFQNLCPESGRGDRLFPIHLVTAPMPPFLANLQVIDFRDPGRYREAFASLVRALKGLPQSWSQAAPRIPDPPSPPLPAPLREQCWQLLAEGMGVKPLRIALASLIGKPGNFLEGFPSLHCAANTALQQAIAADDAVKGTIRLLEQVVEAELVDEEPARRLVAALRRLEPRGGGLLDRYLKKVANDHAELLPYFREKGAQAVLDRVYVQLDLSVAARAGRDRGEARLPEGPLGLKDLLALEPEEYPWVTRRWVVKGDPGSGKTTLLRHLAWELASAEKPRWVPVYAPLPTLLREHDTLLARQERLLKQAGRQAEGLVQVLEQEGRDGRLLLLLDGLDEVPQDRRPDADALLRELAHNWPRTPVVVATRPIGYRSPASAFHEVQLLPLDEDRMVEFLARWFGRERTGPDWHRGAQELEKLRGPLWEIAQVPLYLTLIALILQEGGSPSHRRSQLYDQVFELLLEGRQRDPAQPMPLRAATEAALRHVAYGMTVDNRDAEPVTAIEDRLWEPEADPFRRKLERQWRRGMREFLNALGARAGILGPHDGPDADWRFWHRSFKEALAAWKMHRQVATCGEERLGQPGEWDRTEVKQRDSGAVQARKRQTRAEIEAAGLSPCLELATDLPGDESRWAEPFALLTGRLQEPDRLLKKLVKTNRDLGLRALATAQAVSAETVYEVLELTDKWEKRRKVYPEIPALLEGDPERALLLLKRLGEETTNGNDLYFIDEAMGVLGERHVDLRTRVKQYRERLYNHLPAPDPELFSWVETCDGRVPLWAEIPAGTFRMGSPEGEEGRFHDREGPQHEVHIAHPFRLAVVPVTNAQYANFDPGFEARGWSGVAAEALARHPAVNITWYQAVSFCRWLSARRERCRGARLPREAEWESACRAGTATRYWSGDAVEDLDRVGWYKKNSGGRTHAVGEKPANAWGLYDVHGNAREWCADPWESNYAQHRDGRTVDPSTPPPAGKSASPRVIRGGSYWLEARRARSAFRNGFDPWFDWYDLGFRVLLPQALDL